MGLDEREGSVEYYKRLRTLWGAWEPSGGCMWETGKKGPESKLARWEGLWGSCGAPATELSQLQSSDISLGYLHQSAQVRVAGGQVFMT